jgi:AcrR family transcriptional regulator
MPQAIRVNTLRGRAIDEAMAMVEARGIDALNLRDLAAQLGTGAASLYYHFRNKDALLAELAAEGFRQLQSSFAVALEHLDTRSPLQACGRAYLRFAGKRPGLYRVMYSDRLLSTHAVAREAEKSAFRTFAQGISHDQSNPAVLADRALVLWAFGRGIAALSASSVEVDIAGSRTLDRRIVRGLESLIGTSVGRNRAGHDQAGTGAVAGQRHETPT